MQQGQIVFTRMDRVLFGKPAAQALVEEADRLGAKRVFLLVSRSLRESTSEVQTVIDALGDRYAGYHDHMPPHSPRDAVIECANKARDAGADLLVTFGGGSATDGGKAVTLCLKHDLRDPAQMEDFRTWVDENGSRHIPNFAGPDVRQIVIPTTLSGGEFNARAGITDPKQKLKQSFMHPDIIPVSVILDPAVTVHTPEWLWLSTGIRAVDHAVETFCSIDANHFTDGPALQALRLLSEALPQVKADPMNLEARLKCQIGAWLSMTGIVTGTRLGASHAIGHILGGSADVPHGYTSCIMLPYVLAYNTSANGERQRELSRAMGQAATPASELLDELISGLGMPRRLRDVDIRDDQLEQLAKNCMLDDWTFSNPKPIREPAQVMEILRSAL
ncbi:MAG: iron-containing alcohol dehydrogenase [Gammaproteobacteria bacterium]|nr:iron-containing alcohol dehydrogenase [Gammaproteobacteria bacterium]